VVVDPGETQVLVGPVAQKLKEPGMRGLRRKAAGVNLKEQVP
jgi:hypothetical protein